MFVMVLVSRVKVQPIQSNLCALTIKTTPTGGYNLLEPGNERAGPLINARKADIFHRFIIAINGGYRGYLTGCDMSLFGG